ncbi:MAG: Bax inhibitor-1/YccA family protein [Bacteroidaceae bacterium]|nr:Bax inhibitor-1/YccA family protein [Bacteroidaceae bacterium]
MKENISTVSGQRIRNAQMAVFRQMYVWMTLALAITGITALIISNDGELMYKISSDPTIVWIAVIAELALVITLASRIHKMSLGTATIVFIIYSILNGVTMSLLFLAYAEATITSTFFVTAGTFAAVSLYGYVTKSDLSSWGSIFMMALIGIIIASIVNIFMESSTLYWIITYAGVLIFVGLTAYDTQKIKHAIFASDASETAYKIALMGALELYLDFINLFIYLLRIFGNRD